MKITIDLDAEMIHDLDKHIERLKVYERVGFADAHPTDTILLRVQEAIRKQNGK